MLSIGSHDLAIRRAERLCVDNVWQEIGEAYNRGFKHSSQDSLTRFRKDGQLAPLSANIRPSPAHFSNRAISSCRLLCKPNVFGVDVIE